MNICSPNQNPSETIDLRPRCAYQLAQAMRVAGPYHTTIFSWNFRPPFLPYHLLPLPPPPTRARLDNIAGRERSGGGSSRSNGRSSSSRSNGYHDMTQAPYRPGLGASQDSASGSPFRSSASSRNGSRRNGMGGDDVPEPKERRRRRNRNVSMGQGEGQSIVAAAMATFGEGNGSGNPGVIAEGGWGGSMSLENSVPSPATRKVADAEAAAAVAAAELGVVTDGEATMSFRDTTNSMEDDERETLLALLSGAYGQVRENDRARERTKASGW